jgi:hypothetical protein
MTAYVPVRLCDVPLHVRQAAARRVVRKESCDPEPLLLAAMFPSMKVYWLPADAKQLVEALTASCD